MALDDTIRQLVSIPILRHLDRDALRLLAFSAETRLLRAGDTLFKEGEEADGALFLVAGEIMLEKAGPKEPVKVRAPALLGEMALFTATTRPASAHAVIPATVMRITRTLFRRVLEEFPAVGPKMQADLASRIAAHAADLDRFARNDR